MLMLLFLLLEFTFNYLQDEKDLFITYPIFSI